MASIIFRIITSTGWAGYLERIANKDRGQPTQDVRTCDEPLDSYKGADKYLAHPTSRFILFAGQNISFDASPVIYTHSTNIPQIMIINRIYETQNLLSLQLPSFLVGLRTYQHPCTVEEFITVSATVSCSGRTLLYRRSGLVRLPSTNKDPKYSIGEQTFHSSSQLLSQSEIRRYSLLTVPILNPPGPSLAST